MNTTTRRGSAVTALLVFVLSAIWAAVPSAQTPTATTGVVAGTVSDTSEAVLPGVIVVLTDLNTSASRETATSGSGHFAFGNVLPGRYRIVASLEGFQQAVVPELTVEVSRSHTVDLKLGRGSDRVLTCDLTKEYVEINGDYRT